MAQIIFCLLLHTQLMSKFSNLIKLAKKGDVERLVEAMNQHTGNPNEIDAKTGQGLIHIAVQHDDQELFRVLVKRPGCDLEATTNQGETPLQIAVRLNSPWMVNQLLDHNVNFRRKNMAGETVLQTALRTQTNKDILKRLTTNKFDINEPIEQYGSYLNLAITAGHSDNFYFLFKELPVEYTKRIDINGNTCLILAVKHSKGDIVVQILQKVKEDPLLTAMDRQFFINHQNNHGNTAIHEATLKNMQTISQKLQSQVELGIDLSLRNKKGLTFEDIKKIRQKERLNEIEMQKKKQEEKVVRKKEKNEEKLRQKEEEQRQRTLQLKRKKEEQKRNSIEASVKAQTMKKKSIWIISILLIIILCGMYLALTNAIEKKKPVTL